MVNLVLRFKLIGQADVRIVFATRIQIDGNGQLLIWSGPAVVPEAVDLRDVDHISIERVVPDAHGGLKPLCQETSRLSNMPD